MWYLIIIFIILILVLPLMLRLRVKTSLNKNERLLFAGLGRSGIEINFSSKEKALLLFGRAISKSPLTPEKKEKKPEKPPKPKKKKAKRKRSVKEILTLIPQISVAFWRYSFSLITSSIIEELNGSVIAGFESPDKTGYVYGFYSSLCGAMPGFSSHLQYTPVWDSACFEPSIKATVALPLYRLCWRTLVLLKDLPLRKIIKMAIGTKERSHDG